MEEGMVYLQRGEKNYSWGQYGKNSFNPQKFKIKKKKERKNQQNMAGTGGV